MTACRFLSCINYLAVWIAARDNRPGGIDKCHTRELQRQLRSKLKNSQREMLERFVNGQDVFNFQLTVLYESLGSRTSDN